MSAESDMTSCEMNSPANEGGEELPGFSVISDLKLTSVYWCKRSPRKMYIPFAALSKEVENIYAPVAVYVREMSYERESELLKRMGDERIDISDFMKKGFVTELPSFGDLTKVKWFTDAMERMSDAGYEPFGVVDHDGKDQTHMLHCHRHYYFLSIGYFKVTMRDVQRVFDECCQYNCVVKSYASLFSHCEAFLNAIPRSTYYLVEAVQPIHKEWPFYYVLLYHLNRLGIKVIGKCTYLDLAAILDGERPEQPVEWDPETSKDLYDPEKQQ